MKNITSKLIIPLTFLVIAGCSSNPKIIYHYGVPMTIPSGQPDSREHLKDKNNNPLGELACYSESNTCLAYKRCNGVLSKKPFAKSNGNYFSLDLNQDGKVDGVVTNLSEDASLADYAQPCHD